MKMGFYLKALTGFFVAGVAFFAYSQQGCASGIAKQTCDTQVWKTMENRAHLEAEREIMMNQNLIFKPDSILTYTCFDKMTSHASIYVGQLFTHTTYWNGKLIIPWGKDFGMNYALQNVVINSMKPYIQGSFAYPMLGGRGKEMGGAALDAKAPEDINGNGETYACDQMSKVWKAAKCANFIHNSKFSETDGFYPFLGLEPHNGGQKIKGYDEIKETRRWPADLSCAGEGWGGEAFKKPIYDSDWKTKFLDSKNEKDGAKDRYYQFGTPLGNAFIAVREKVEPGECSDPVKTGVTVLESPSGSGEPYDDGVCTNPGCVYTKSGQCTKAGGGGT